MAPLADRTTVVAMPNVGRPFPRSRRRLNYTGNKHIGPEAVPEKQEGLKVVREGDLIELRGPLPFETPSKAN
ncbi:hypothetical protein Y032_0150g2763 [Ancylostoma ceylanicum]|uniref:Uncharacterized protein n=1 Tax=Ancylostoma ceylanicum TaxID=53326 RepID=A0A016T0D7_9BILA|nr:hypothetical protein Y032_0150g2763 [Ancylostoma ceylanicum]